MKYIHLLLLLFTLFILSLYSCGRNSCQTCILERAGASSTTEVCEDGDGLEVTTDGELQPDPEMDFDTYIDLLEIGGYTCE